MIYTFFLHHQVVNAHLITWLFILYLLENFWPDQHFGWHWIVQTLRTMTHMPTFSFKSVWKDVCWALSFHKFIDFNIFSHIFLPIMISILLACLSILIRHRPSLISSSGVRWWSFFLGNIFSFFLQFSILNLRLQRRLRSLKRLFLNIFVSFFGWKHHLAMILKDDNKGSEIIHRHFFHWLFYYFGRHFSDKLIFLLLFKWFFFCVPKTLSNLLVAQFVIDAIRTNHHKIVLFAVYLEVCYFWFGDQNLRVSFIFR